MSLLTWLLIEFILLLVWIGLIILDNLEYRKYIKRSEERRKAKKLAEKKRVRELKWPDYLPHDEL